MRAFLFGVLLLPALAWAQAYPSKPIRLLLPYGAGGVADITARTVAPKMAEALGQPLVIENKPSAGGIVAAQEVARAAPDGHTLLFTLANTILIAPQLVRARPYELKDFTPIMVVSKAATCMLASVSFPL